MNEIIWSLHLKHMVNDLADESKEDVMERSFKKEMANSVNEGMRQKIDLT